MSFGGAPVMLAGGAPDDRREWQRVGMMLGRSWSERDCERTRPQNVIPSRDRMTSSSSPTRWHHRRRSRSTLFHRIGTFCAILAPKVCCRSGGWDRKKGRSKEICCYHFTFLIYCSPRPPRSCRQLAVRVMIVQVTDGRAGTCSTDERSRIGLGGLHAARFCRTLDPR